MLAVLQGNDSLPVWAVVATADDYERLAEQYKHTQGERLLLHWDMMKGVCIMRANLYGCQMSQDFTNIDIALDNLAAPHRAGLYMPVYNTIRDFLK